MNRNMMYHISMDSFGSECPTNWDEIATALNERLDGAIAELGEDAYDWEIKEVADRIWESYCNGEISDVPEAKFE